MLYTKGSSSLAAGQWLEGRGVAVEISTSVSSFAMENLCKADESDSLFCSVSFCVPSVFFPSKPFFAKECSDFLELHGGMQQQCPSMSPSSLDHATRCEFTGSEAALSEQQRSLVRGMYFGVQ